MRSGRRECNAHRPRCTARPARCMHASAACNARILPREASRGDASGDLRGRRDLGAGLREGSGTRWKRRKRYSRYSSYSKSRLSAKGEKNVYTKAAFRNSLPVLEIYSLHYVYCRFSVLAVNFGTQPKKLFSLGTLSVRSWKFDVHVHHLFRGPRRIRTQKSFYCFSSVNHLNENRRLREDCYFSFNTRLDNKAKWEERATHSYR